jgi:hypothetical protein
MMEAARTSEMLVDIQLRTRQYIPEDSELHTRCRENLKSHIFHINLKYSNAGWKILTTIQHELNNRCKYSVSILCLSTKTKLQVRYIWFIKEINMWDHMICHYWQKRYKIEFLGSILYQVINYCRPHSIQCVYVSIYVRKKCSNISSRHTYGIHLLISRHFNIIHPLK